MMRLNNKGQSLVLFVLLIPALLGVMALVFDLGNSLTVKNEIDSVIEMVLDGEIQRDGTKKEDNSLSDDDIKEEFEDSSLVNTDIRKKSMEVLLTYNLSKVDFEVEVNENNVNVVGSTYVEGIFSRILNVKGFFVVSEYNYDIESKSYEKVK